MVLTTGLEPDYSRFSGGRLNLLSYVRSERGQPLAAGGDAVKATIVRAALQLEEPPLVLNDLPASRLALLMLAPPSFQQLQHQLSNSAFQ